MIRFYEIRRELYSDRQFMRADYGVDYAVTPENDRYVMALMDYGCSNHDFFREMIEDLGWKELLTFRWNR